MIPKPFVSIAIAEDITNVSSRKLLDSLSSYGHVRQYNKILTQDFDIIITMDKKESRACFINIIVDFESEPGTETIAYRLFQPFLHEKHIEPIDLTLQLTEYVKSIISIYHLPIIQKNTTLELE